jgi:hypothetical protein
MYLYDEGTTRQRKEHAGQRERQREGDLITPTFSEHRWIDSIRYWWVVMQHLWPRESKCVTYRQLMRTHRNSRDSVCIVFTCISMNVTTPSVDDIDLEKGNDSRWKIVGHFVDLQTCVSFGRRHRVPLCRCVVPVYLPRVPRRLECGETRRWD